MTSFGPPSEGPPERILVPFVPFHYALCFYVPTAILHLYRPIKGAFIIYLEGGLPMPGYDVFLIFFLSYF